MKLKAILLTLLCSMALTTMAQVPNLPRKVLNNKEYYVYTVESGEGLYSISKKFGISENDIIKYNPAVKNGLKRDQVLFIPVEEGGETAVVNESTPFYHTIKRGETISAIAKMYGVTIDQICDLNPGKRDRINAGDKLLIPQTSEKATSSSKVANNSTAPSYQYHTVVSGETFYAIAGKYNVTVEQIIRANPGVKPKKLAAGAVIRIPVEQVVAEVSTPTIAEETTPAHKETLVAEEVPAQNETVNNNAVEDQIQPYRTYTAKKKETLYSIAQKFDIPLDTLKALNPNARKIKNGTIIYLPNEEAETQSNRNTPQPKDANEAKEQIEAIYDRVYAKKDIDQINVAIMLPFMLHVDSADVQTSVRSALFTEYYEGFLLAVDSLKRQGYSINLHAYDTERSVDRVRHILEDPILTTMDLIVAPDDDEAINMIADFGEQHDINVVNNFSMRNEKVNTNARLFQTNIPGSYLYAESVAQFIKTFKNRTIVFLDNRNANDATENEFVVTLQDELGEQNIPFTTCSYSDMIEQKDLLNISSNSVVFVPTSNKKELLATLLPALEEYMARRPFCDVSLMGYPAWVTQINKYATKFHKLDTYIFSRFFTHPDDKALYDFSVKYLYWYSEEMKNATPRYALMGYDTGMYFLTAIALGGKNFANYDLIPQITAIQTDFDFERINNWSGFINKAFYYIHFTTDLQIEKIRL